MPHLGSRILGIHTTNGCLMMNDDDPCLAVLFIFFLQNNDTNNMWVTRDFNIDVDFRRTNYM